MPIVLTTYPTAGFNSYASLEFLKARLDGQLRDYSQVTDDKLRAALIAATEYLDVRFSYVGYRQDPGQEREWPRAEAYDVRGDLVVGIPLRVQQACCEYAWRAVTADLMPDPTQDDAGRAVKSKSEEVGPLKTSVEYELSLGAQLPSYPKADGLLTSAGLIRRRGGFTVGTLARG